MKKKIKLCPLEQRKQTKEIAKLGTQGVMREKKGLSNLPVTEVK
jgi:hypothetical protein